GCGIAGCHQAPNGLGSPRYNLNIPQVSAADSSNNWSQSTCNDRFTSYGAAPAGRLLSYFCTASGTPSGAPHQGKTVTALNCTDLFAWAGEGQGVPVNCP